MNTKRLISFGILAVAVMSFALGVAKAEVSVSKQSEAPMQALPDKWQPKDPEKVAFVLAEVRKQLETNPKNQIAELSVDPDFRGNDDVYLVNVILTAYELQYSLGAVVKLRPAASGWATTVAFVD
jgi:hypothetical protein